MQASEGRIDLAHAPTTRIGRLVLDPPTRLVRRDDGIEEVVEPRMMQVLLALAQAEGDIVTRDTLTERCWEGRVVGEDAINRVISRLRRTAEGIGEGSFRLETITRVGYRLIADGMVTSLPLDSGHEIPSTETAGPLQVSRRTLIAGAGATVLAAAGAGLVLIRRPRSGPTVPPEIADLMSQAAVAARQGTADGNATAVGLYRHAIELRPDYAQGWAELAQAYALSSHSVQPNLMPAYDVRARQAVARALALDPGNVDAGLALAMLLPRMRHWWEVEQACRKVLAVRPDDYRAAFHLSTDYASVGRCREQAAILDHVTASVAPAPALLYQHCQSLWAAGRLDDADRATEEAFRISPRQFQVWFTRFYLFLYTQRIEQAIAMAQDVENRPTGIESSEFDNVIAVARAMKSRDPQAIDAVERQQIIAPAHRGAGYAENSIQFASALGRLDTAFRIADGYYLDRGFPVGSLRFSQQQGAYSTLADRRTHVLFLPSTAAMRADPRFDRLVAAVGLKRYWRESGSRPDYLAGRV